MAAVERFELESMGWPVCHGAEISPGESAAERADYAEVVPT